MRVLLLYLDGSIYRAFDTIQDCSRLLGIRQIPTRGLNKDSILKRKYRMVTESFYRTNLDEILSWGSKTKGEISAEFNREKEAINKKKRIVLYTDSKGVTTQYKNYCTLAKVLGLSHERIRQIIHFGGKKYNIRFKHPELRVRTEEAVFP